MFRINTAIMTIIISTLVGTRGRNLYWKNCLTDLRIPIHDKNTLKLGRMTYIPSSETKAGTAKIIYESKNLSPTNSGNGRSSKTFDALYWLAQLTTHIPNRGEQIVSYYGYYSNKIRGMRKGIRARKKPYNRSCWVLTT